MPSVDDPHLLDLLSVSDRCARQTELFFRRQPTDSRYCFELFRRAMVDRNQHAWERLYAQYRPLVAGWVKKHSGFTACGDDVPHLVNCAFQKMWSAMTPAKFAGFADVKPLLRYLQMCVHSAIVDALRSAESLEDVDPSGFSRVRGQSAASVEDQALARVQSLELWQVILARMKDDRERKVVHGSFALGLKPRELCAEFPAEFQDVNEVYRIKENVLGRLRRDAELGESLGLDA